MQDRGARAQIVADLQDGFHTIRGDTDKFYSKQFREE
jgi:hypothetical protein